MNIERIINEVERERRKILVRKLYDQGLSQENPILRVGTAYALKELAFVDIKKTAELYDRLNHHEECEDVIIGARQARLNMMSIDPYVSARLDRLLGIEPDQFEIFTHSWDEPETEVVYVNVQTEADVKLKEDITAIGKAARRNPKRFLEEYAKIMKLQHFDRPTAMLAKTVAFMAATLHDKRLAPVKDAEYAFLRTYLESRYIHKESDRKKEQKAEDTLIRELIKLVRLPDRNYTRLHNILDADKANSLTEMIRCSEIDVPECTILRKLGRGSDGVVYQATHDLLGEVKIKIFTDPKGKMKRAVKKEGITLEERIKRRILLFDKQIRDYRHLTKMYYPGECKDPETGKDTLYLVMDYVDGGAIETSAFGRYQIRPDIRDPDEIYSIFKKMLSGLERLHNAGLVLKDVKLRNTLCSKDHNTVLIDDLETISGINEMRQGARLTEGSDRYAAPEVMEDIKTASQRSDVYSAGVCLLYLLTRQPTSIARINTAPDSREYYKRLDRILKSAVKDNPNGTLVQDSLNILRKALAYNPKRRYKDAGVFKIAVSEMKR